MAETTYAITPIVLWFSLLAIIFSIFGSAHVKDAEAAAAAGFIVSFLFAFLAALAMHSHV